MMQRIQVGQLRVLTEDGIYQFPPPNLNNDLFEESGKTLDDGEAAPRAEIRVLNDSFWIRLVLLGDLGFSEAFMWGNAEVDDLAALFRVSRRSSMAFRSSSSELSSEFQLRREFVHSAAWSSISAQVARRGGSELSLAG